MTAKILTFNKAGYDPFIDFLKAYSIVCVVFAHIFPAPFYKYILFQVWGDMQVPMFVLIQVFHAYKKEIRPKLNWSTILKRIFFPFVVVQAVILCIKALSGGGILWSSFMDSGGYGPGSYYIWIYLQIAIILVLVWSWLKELTLKQALIIFLIVSVGFEILFSAIDCSDKIYRLLCTRYLFLVPLGLFWVRKGVVLNKKTLLLSIISIAAVLFFVFSNLDLEPFFFNTKWKFHRWICYFYLPILLTYGLYLLWNRIKENQVVEKAVKWTAARSYEIFLAQMTVIACIKTFIPSLTSKGIMLFIILVIVIFSFSFSVGGFIYWSRKSLFKW